MICSSKLGTKARNSFKSLEERFFKVHGEKYNNELGKLDENTMFK